MIRNVQLKIILIFGIIGIVLISFIGIFYGMSLKEVGEVQGYNSIVNTQIHNVKYITTIAEGLYGIITILVAIFISKAVINPITKLITEAPKIVSGENVSVNKANDNKKKKDVDELTNAFDIMTNELRENLNEVSRQKKQIETILLHMTDGIIAFDMQGNITHINPAATELLRLNEKDNSFRNNIWKTKYRNKLRKNSIFGRLDLFRAKSNSRR